MQRVPDKFYTWYNIYATVVGGVFALLALAVWLVPPLQFLRTQIGLTPVTVIVGFAQLIYGFVFFKGQWAKNPWTAALFGSMILSVITIGLFHNSGGLHSPMLIMWAITIFISGIFGLYGTLGVAFITTMYYVLYATGSTETNLFDPVGFVAVVASYVIAIISSLFWKRFYINIESAQIQQLSGQLSNTKAQSASLIESITDGIIVTDAENKIQLLNPSASKMTGWAINEAIGIDASLVIKLQLESGKELEEGDNPFQTLARTLQPTTVLMRLVSKTDSFLITSISVSPILKQDGKTMAGSVAVLRDVSDARAEENRRADFISTASHEMRTPVAAIEGYLQLSLNDKVAKIDSKARDFLMKALDSTHHLGQLFQDLLTSAKAEDGRLVSHPRVVEVGALLEKLTEDLRFSAEKKGLLLDFRVGATAQDAASTSGGKVIKPLYYALVDPDRMQEVMTNLFDNAVKYSDTGKITVALTGNNDVVQFFIKDTGQGIPKDDIPHLFQKFYRVDNSATRTIGGTGLGLFICKRIVEIYKGRIWVESEQGKGSTFYINLPRLSAQKAAELQQAEAQTPS